MSVPQSLAAIHLHVIFSTKNREPWLAADLAPRIHAYFGGIARSNGSCLHTSGGMPDHVHLLLSLGREQTVAGLVGGLKAASSRWVHDTFADRAGFGWQAGYGAFSVSPSQLSVVRSYIDTQAEHHRARTFQEEYRRFLQKHGIECDERYVWD